MSFFSVHGLSAGYGREPVLSSVSFSLDRGKVMGVLGGNGCGKTTLLKAICGILPHEGSCTLNGVSLDRLPPRRLSRLLSYIPQRSGISIDITVLDVVLMGFNPHLRLLEHPTANMREQALSALKQVGLSGKESVNYLHLSEGQKQLCILARTLVSSSFLLLLDEPESSLDFQFRYSMLVLLRSIAASQQKSAIVTLHDPQLALNACDELLLVHEGRVLCILHPPSSDLSAMEQALSIIYGSVSLSRIANRSGQNQLVMLKEEKP